MHRDQVRTFGDLVTFVADNIELGKVVVYSGYPGCMFRYMKEQWHMIFPRPRSFIFVEGTSIRANLREYSRVGARGLCKIDPEKVYGLELSYDSAGPVFVAQVYESDLPYCARQTATKIAEFTRSIYGVTERGLRLYMKLIVAR